MLRTQDTRAIRRLGPSDTLAIARFGWWLVLITAGGLVLRVLIVYLARHTLVGGDGFGYGIQANLNARGRWFVDSFNGRPDALHPPAWPLVLTAWAWVGEHSWLSQQLLACGIGTATVAVTGLAGRRVAGERTGLVAAGIAAVYPGLWVYERALLSETLMMLGIAVIVLVAYTFRERPSARLAAVLGVLCGLVALTRSEQILILPLLVAPLILTMKGAGWQRRIRWLALACLCALIVPAPWTIYNLGRFRRPVLLSNNFGPAVLQGNCADSFYGSRTGSYTFACVTSQPRDQSVADAHDLRIGLTYAEHHLRRLPIVLFAREGRAFGFWRPIQTMTWDAEFESWPSTWGPASYRPGAIWVGRMALFGYWLLLVPAIAGAFLLRRRRIPVYPFLAFVATVVLSVAATYGQTRARAAAEVPLVLLAAVSLAAVLRTRRTARRSATSELRLESNVPSDHGDRQDSPADAVPVRSLRRGVPVPALAIAGVAVALTAVLGPMSAAAPRTKTITTGPPKIILPRDGAKLTEATLLAAWAQSGVRRVEFRITGRARNDVLIATAKLSRFGWLATWDTTKFPNGRYLIRVVAYTGTKSSSGVARRVTIANDAHMTSSTGRTDAS